MRWDKLNNMKTTPRIKYIKTIQRYLGISQTGVIGVEEKELIRDFQAENSLTVSGTVTYETFELLKKRYLALNPPLGAVLSIDFSFPISRGSIGSSIAELNAMLERILIEYEYSGILPRGRLFDEKTERAVREIGMIFGFGERDSVDRALYIRILREIILMT
jgi:peptidoglycan hydrolase-like protein with peptidoglycan-binding domain